MVLLIDTNILLDVLDERKGFVEDSLAVWKICESGKAKGYISTLSFVNMIYVMRKKYSKDKITNLYKISNLIFAYSDLSSETLRNAAEMGWPDYEDAIQEVTAEYVKADYIVTRNIADFKNSNIETITPTELISKFV